MGMLSLVVVNLNRNWLRTLLTQGSVMVALFLFCTLGGVLDTLQAAANAGSRERMATRNAISLTQWIPGSYQNRIAAIPGVKRVCIQNWFGALDPNDRHGFFAQFAVDENFWPLYRKDLDIVEWSTPQVSTGVAADQDPHLAAYFLERSACVVGADLMKKKHWKVGQSVKLDGTIFPGSWEFVIRGVYRMKPGGAFRGDMMFFHYDYLSEKGMGGARYVGVYKLAIADPSQSASIARQVDAMFENSDAATLTESEQAFQAGFVSMYGNVGFALRIIGLAVVFTILLIAANTMVTAIRERTSEYGVMKTLGFSDGMVFTLVVVEAAIITLGGGVVGALLAKFAVQGANLGFLPPMVVQWSTVFTGIGLAVLIGAVSGLVPAIRASRLRIVDALRRVD
jgi:putative ABC transport system permease protein